MFVLVSVFREILRVCDDLFRSVLCVCDVLIFRGLLWFTLVGWPTEGIRCVRKLADVGEAEGCSVTARMLDFGVSLV